MKTELVKENGKLTVSVVGNLDTATAPELEKAVFDHLDGVAELVLDLSEMPYTSSAGLRTVLKLQKAMNQKGTMKVTHVCDEVMEIFELTGFSDFLTIE